MKHNKIHVHSINGDWSSTGIERQINYLKNKSQIHAPAGSIIKIDCSKVENIDYNGFQLLYVWMKLLQNNGLECSLCKIPEKVYEELKRLGLKHLF